MNQTGYPLTRLMPAGIKLKLSCRILLLPVLSALMFPSLLSAQVNSALCPVSLDIPPRPRVAVSLEPGDIFLTADDAESTEGGLSILTGNAEMVHN
ncbi:MAG: hypothetical protein WD709_07730, partial [Gammaproteobacteria bacterium]